mgnify:CR=1 FL=1
MKVCFIGFGNMATAIAKGLTDQNDLDIHACSPSLTEGARVNNVTMHKDNHQGSKEADIIILAVKPPKILSVLQELSIHKDTLIGSMTDDQLCDEFRHKVKIKIQSSWVYNSISMLMAPLCLITLQEHQLKRPVYSSV